MKRPEVVCVTFTLAVSNAGMSGGALQTPVLVDVLTLDPSVATSLVKTYIFIFLKHSFYFLKDEHPKCQA